MAASRKKPPARKSSRSSKTRNAAETPDSGSGARRKKPAAPTPARKGRGARPTNPDSMPDDVIELITAIDEYKRKNARLFPSWSEILQILKDLGYRKSA